MSSLRAMVRGPTKNSIIRLAAAAAAATPRDVGLAHVVAVRHVLDKYGVRSRRRRLFLLTAAPPAEGCSTDRRSMSGLVLAAGGDVVSAAAAATATAAAATATAA